MKFCDKLQKIRKENNVTQEQLADKLDVSRQAVSKWESGTAYPDTEKLIQISKIFKVSLDELINDEVQVNKENNTSKKYNFMDIFNVVFEFISKSFSMFWAMKFKDKIKLLFEMAVLVFALIIASHITVSIITEIIRRIFIFLPGRISNYIAMVVDNILYVGCLVIGVIVAVKVFKTRYLDYYVVIADDTVEERVLEEPIKELKEKKDYKVVIRDPEHSSFNFFKKIYEGFILILKVFALIMAVPIIITFITAVMFFVISLAYAVSGLFFSGISLAILGGIVFIFLILEFIFNLLFNRKHAYLRIFILFILSLVMIGSGAGLSFTALNDFEIVNDSDMTTDVESLYVTMTDNMVIDDINNIDEENIVIDNNLRNIKIDVKTYGNVSVRTYTHTFHDENDDYREYLSVNIIVDYDDMKTFKTLLEDAKNKRIRTYDATGYEIDKLYISQDNLTKIKENYKKLYD